jgi:hypothetical protein
MEKIFSYIWKTENEKNRLKIGYLSLEDYLTQLQMFTKMAAPFDVSGDLGGSLWSVGFVDKDLLLPKEIHWTTNKNLNLRLIQLLILKSIAIKALDLTFAFHDRQRVSPRLYILSKMPQINLWLDSCFPLFSFFEKTVLAELETYMENKIKRSDPVFVYWKKQIARRTVLTTTDSDLELQSLLSRQKRNDIPPFFLHATVPLPFRRLSLSPENTAKMGSKNISEEKQTQKKRNQKEFTENVDEKKQESVNPILHSFEKMETADDYDGGRRIESGDDELDSHEQALDELELNRHTSAGEASSLYRQDSQQFKLQQLNNTADENKQSHQYPEWNEKENRYIRSFCTVFPQTPEQKIESESLKQKTADSYQSVILKWKKKLDALVNTPTWKNRLLDGNDIDLDSLIRLTPELKNYSGRPRIYSEKRKTQKDISILILADVSYSTDTWVNGHKVIDIIKDSIAVASFIFQDVFEKVSVAITSSETRKKIHYQELKTFEENWIHFFRRSHELTPHQYTRLGPAIRHATKILAKENTLKPLLILITDGKPTDLDPYEGSHGQKDVRKSIDEAKAAGIHILTLTISDFDPVALKKIFDTPCSVTNPDDFCREVFQFICKTCLKSR